MKTPSDGLIKYDDYFEVCPLVQLRFLYVQADGLYTLTKSARGGLGQEQ